MTREAEPLEEARRYSFRARVDKCEPSGPIFVKGSGSEVEDIDGKRYHAIHRRCFEQGLIFSQRRGGNVLRFVPPATTTPEQLDRAADIFDGVLRAAIDAQSRGG